MVVNIFRRSRGETGAATSERKAVRSGPLVATQSAGRAVWSARDGASLTRAGYSGNPVGFRAVRLISEAAASLPLVLQSAQERFESHPILRLLGAPNPAQGQAELMEALYGQLLLTGNGYLEAAGEAGAVPCALHVLRSDRMQVVPGGDGWPAAYDYVLGARRHRFEVREGLSPVCHIRSFHPQDDHYGFSPMQAAAMAIDVHDSASRWSKALLDNAARPSGAIVYHSAEGQGTLSDEQFRRLQDEMESNHQGARNAGRPMLLEGGLDWKPMGFSPSDMEFHQTKNAAAREIAVAFGVPPMLLGIPGEATYANYQEAHRAFYRLTVLPLATRVAAAVGAWLSSYSGEELVLKPDLDQVPALAGERDQQWARVREADFLSVDEKRALLGLPPLAEELRDA